MADPVYAAVARVAIGLFRALDLRFDVCGEDHIPRSGGGVVVMNHIGYLDFALAGVPFWRCGRRPVRFMAKEEVFRHPISGPLMRGMKHIPVDRSAGAASYRTAIAALRSGELVGVFPEATISRSFCLKEFKSGAARMARDARVPIVPVALWGSQRVWTKGRRRDVRAARHTPIYLTIGAPLNPERGQHPEAINRELVAVMTELVAATQARYPLQTDTDLWWLPVSLGGSAPTPEEAAALDAGER